MGRPGIAARRAWLGMVLLGSIPGWGEEASLSAAALEEDGPVRGAVEISAAGVYSPRQGNATFQPTVTPLLQIEPTSDLFIELGAPLRFEVTSTRTGLRHQDWDERSDFGQLLQSLRVGSEGTPVSFQAGPAFLKTVGHGHLVNRYWNRTLTDYHPASAEMVVAVGAARVEAMASDVLALRLFAAELALDMGRLMFGLPSLDDRLHVAVSAAHDEGRAGGRSPAATLLHVDLDAVLVRSTAVSVTLLGGAGIRPGADAGYGATAGMSVEGRWRKLRLGAVGEVQRRGGGFRYQMFGPSYELSRFAAVGFQGLGLTEERLPDATQGRGELSVQVEGPRAPWMSLSVSVEGLGSTRSNVDGVLLLQPTQMARLLLRGVVTGVGSVGPKLLLLAEARVRVLPSVYGMAHVGTQYQRAADGSLARGWAAGVGAGVDFNASP